MSDASGADKIKWLNGLKGFACLIVFFHHFFLSFYGGIYYGSEAVQRTASGIDIKFGTEPIGVFLNGNFAVCLFIMISAFLFAGKAMKDEINNTKTDLFKLCIGRYLRLLVPVAAIGTLYYCLIKITTIIGTNYAGVTSELSVKELIMHIFVFQWITHDPSIMGPLWCMYVLFLGSFIAFFLGGLSKKNRWFMPIVYLVIAIASRFVNEYYPAVVFGVLLADVFYFERLKLLKALYEKMILQYICGCVFIIVGLLLGGYPSYAQSTNPIYYPLRFLRNAPSLIHTAGAAALILGLIWIPKHMVLESKPFLFVGKISMGIYMIHSMVINLLSYYLKDTFENVTDSYTGGVFASFIVSALLIALIAAIYTKIFEEKLNYLIKKAL